MKDNRLIKVFAELRKQGKKTLAPFITAGFPDLDTTAALLADFQSRGVRVCELGIPFSDPISDGSVIQASYTEALAAGITSPKIFDMVRKFRRASLKRSLGVQDLALVAMVSYSIVFRHGLKQYAADAAAAGIDALLIPDLPLEEAQGAEKAAASCGLANVMLVAPTTPPDRAAEIARHSRGFLYYISIAGITGERTKLPPKTIDAVAELRKHTDIPICVGFGVSNAETVKTVCSVADGAIVGSAIVHRIADAKNKGRDAIVKSAGKFVSELLKPIK